MKSQPTKVATPSEYIAPPRLLELLSEKMVSVAIIVAPMMSMAPESMIALLLRNVQLVRVKVEFSGAVPLSRMAPPNEGE